MSWGCYGSIGSERKERQHQNLDLSASEKSSWSDLNWLYNNLIEDIVWSLRDYSMVKAICPIFTDWTMAMMVLKTISLLEALLLESLSWSWC
jgi:hypothetical protein